MPHHREMDRRPIFAVLFATIAICCVVMSSQLYVRWHNADVKTADVARQTKTGEVARRAGATILPTDRQLAVEPPSRVPKNPEQPAGPG